MSDSYCSKAASRLSVVTPRSAEETSRVKVMVQKRISELNRLIEDARQRRIKRATMRDRKKDNQNDLNSLLDQVSKLSEVS